MTRKKAENHMYTEAQLTFLRLESETPRRELTEAFNRRFGTDLSAEMIKRACLRHGWKTGRTGQFEKGNVPSPNAGPKGANSTSFKKGNRPQTWRPINTERITKDGYRQRKMTDTGYAPRDWVEVHRLVWEEHNGLIPEGYIVQFRDGDRLNCEIDNLMMISRAENAVINKMQLGKVEPELKDQVLRLARLKMKRRERTTSKSRKSACN